MINILLLAPPAAGKGTQSELLQAKYNIKSISTGDLLRKASRRDDEFGKNLQEILRSGKLVSDDIVLSLLKEEFDKIVKSKTINGFLLDGFPRNVNQAEELDVLVEEYNDEIDYVFLLDVPKTVLENRITGRRLCKSCGKIYNVYLDNFIDTCSCGGDLYQRSDDTIEAFQIRYQTYLDSTLPLVEYYQKRGNLIKIDANKTIDEVFQEICSFLNLEVFND